MATSEKRLRRLMVKRNVPKGFSAMVLFLAIALLFEYLVVASFQSMGLTDENAWIETFHIPSASWSLTLTISLLFHILPLSVIVVLLSSWIYLTRHTALVPQRKEPTRRVSLPTRRELEKRRLRALRRSFQRISQRLKRVGNNLKARLQRIRGISYVSQRLPFTKPAMRSTLTVLLTFLCVSILIFIAEYPALIHDSVVALYCGNPAFLGFVLGTTEFAHVIGQAVPPIGGLVSAINNSLVGAAPSFRRILEGVGAPLTGPMVHLDVVGKYVWSQNLAAWVSALSSLAYGAYASSRRYGRVKGR